MQIHVITLFPEMIEQAVQYGIVGQALKQGRIGVSAFSPRAFTTNVHQTIDDRPFGGGDGMIMIAEPAALALKSLADKGARRRVIHLSPRGTLLTDAKARELAEFDELVLISSRYGGMDERLLVSRVDEEVSVGDYILSGGELAALVLVDAVARFIPGVLGNEASNSAESFGGSFGLLEAPQFTRPREWNNLAVPQALLSGDHAKIERFKAAIALCVTAERRPDLLCAASLPQPSVLSALEILRGLSEEEQTVCGLKQVPLISERLTALVTRLDSSPATTGQRKGRA